MPRPSYFGAETPKVLNCIRLKSEYCRKNSVPISLKQLVRWVKADFKALCARCDRESEEAWKKVQASRRKAGQPVKKQRMSEEDRLRHIIFKLARKHKIWFGSEGF
jgi:hypothetical protein